MLLTNILALIQPPQDLLHRRLLLLQLLHLQTLAPAPGLLLQILERLLHELDILDPQFLADDVEIPDRIHVPLDVDNLRIIETSHDLEDRIHGPDMTQKRIAQARPRGSPASQAGNVVDGQVGGDAGFGLVVLAQPVVSLVRDEHAGFLGVDGGVGEVGRVAEFAFGDSLEEGGFADVREADDAGFEVVAWPAEGDLLLLDLLFGRHFATVGGSGGGEGALWGGEIVGEG